MSEEWTPGQPAPTPQQPRLLERVRATLAERRYSPQTLDGWIGWVRQYILFHGKRHPQELTATEINQFLAHLEAEKRTTSEVNQARSALLFLYLDFLGKSVGELGTVMPARHPFDIQETETEYLLFVPATQKERARQIGGGRWDQDRRCWVYPRTGRSYDALIGEFGDDLVSSPIRRPSLLGAEISPAALQEENQRLRTELDGNRRALAILQAEIERLESANAALQTGAVPGGSLEELCRQRAREATGNDPTFVQMIDGLPLDATFPLELGKCLERRLRELLGCGDRAVKFHHLIDRAKAAGLLRNEAIELAHTIRKQRNSVAHDRLDAGAHQGRVLFALFAASLLWPMLPGEGRQKGGRRE